MVGLTPSKPKEKSFLSVWVKSSETSSLMFFFLWECGCLNLSSSWNDKNNESLLTGLMSISYNNLNRFNHGFNV